MATVKGYIGYNGARHLATGRAPQHIQNLVIRDYCRRHDLPFKLSASEYAMPHCYMMLEYKTKDTLRCRAIEVDF